MTFRRLLGFLAPYKYQAIATALLAAGTQAAGLVIPYLTGRIIDAAQAGDSRRTIYEYALLIVAAGAVRATMMFFRRWLAGRLSLAVEYDLRNRMYAHMQRLSHRFFEPPPTGPAASRGTGGVPAGGGLPRYRPDFFSPPPF